MGFVKSILTGKPNTFRATAPVNKFEAQGATLNEADYSDAIRRAQADALAVNPQQQALADSLAAAAAGLGPSVAENQLRQATDKNVQQTAGLIASQRGLNPALAARIAANAGARSGQDLAGQAATLRAGEQIAARGQLGDVLGQMQQGATSLAGTAGGLNAAQNEARIRNVLGRESINAGVAAGNQQADLGAQGINAGVAQSNANFQSGLIGGILQGAGSVLGSALAPAPKRAAHGAVVPGKAHVPGDDPANDTVPILASPEEIVLPRSVTTAPDAPERAAEFVAAIKAKKGGRDGSGFGKVLAGQRAIEDRLARLERAIPGDADLGAKREADLPDYQLPVYRGETAAGRMPAMMAGRMSDGGEVTDPSLVAALKAWWAKEGDSQPEGRKVADAMNAKLPAPVSGRVLVEANERKRRALEAALAVGN